ncbi:hypothetical protein ASPZODRAFT_1435024 [Penicilliopsis zonata CBS 506.65]|uniref:Zn(2)-C6 fungal-type domain-containing protein n=1 Tax=Penicilliopsis zonata CBS 506.65 TaxID=1073090 RepID=A0A1L9SPQ8_9EURO|nr:hypothetical protein ASPZODRAFT_1435024 [Penicilliopsis zonata CBS 506.65]OJJ49242.1 hypothetical protein ASPZODRAFT_1435024 [Penicilliopsis zonata CBS 506.65]
MSTQGNRRALGPGYSREILPRPPAQSHDQSRFQAAPSAARKANVSLACATCRKLKVKCDGCTPCSTCVSRNIGDSCTYETDNRRKGILKEKLRDSQQEISHLQRILHRLRFTDDTAATFLLGQIRSGLTVEELIKHIDTTVAVGGSSTPERNTLIKDSRLKRRLVGLYFEWQHPYVPIFSGQEVPDLPGPEDNRTSELLISPVIEAIMAIGSWYHDYTETTNIPGIDMEELRVLLVEEADRLLTADNNSRGSELDPVATIQASIILVTRDLAAGESETAWSRLGTAVLTAISLAWEVDASHEVNANADRSRATYWALYLTDRCVDKFSLAGI